jgi:hypothetical protein
MGGHDARDYVALVTRGSASTRRSTAIVLAWALWLCAPTTCLADDGAPSILSYGLKGFWTGAEIGLAVGYLSTGSDFTSSEWKSLAIGAGIGAIAGLGVGITLGVVDTGSDMQPGTGWYVLRDLGYGVTLGALAGTAIGAIAMIDSGRWKNLPIGASIGALIGGAAGIAIGFVEAANADPRATGNARTAQARLRLTLTTVDSDWTPVPAVEGRF